jgi:hypothetical protein
MQTTITIECDTTEESQQLFQALANLGSNTVSVQQCSPKCDVKANEVVKEAVKAPSKVITETLPTNIRKSLEARANELGINFRSDIGDKPLQTKISNFLKDNPQEANVVNDPVDLTDEDEDQAYDVLQAKIKAEHVTKSKEEEVNEEAPEEQEDTQKQEESEEPEEETKTKEVTESKEAEEVGESELDKAFTRRNRRAVKSRDRRSESSSKISWD